MNSQQLLTAELNKITLNSLAKILTGNGRRVNNLPSPSNQPKFIIKYGPPASGKGSAAVRTVIEGLGDPINSYININVDDAVESTQVFKNKSRALVNTLRRKPTNANFNAFLNHASASDVKSFSNAYTSVRFGKNSKGVNIGAKMDDLLQQAFNANKNITFETTGGTGFPTWIWKTYKKVLDKYKIVVIFPLVPFEETWRRYKKRPVNAYKNGTSGFRFGATKSQLRQTYESSYKYMKSALNTNTVGWIDEIYILGPTDQVILFPKRTNSSQQNQLLAQKKITSYLNNIKIRNLASGGTVPNQMSSNAARVLRPNNKKNSKNVS